MKKTIYLLLGLFLLAPAFARSSAKADTYEYVFAYTAVATGTPDYYDVTVGFWQMDLNTGVATNIPAPVACTITVTGGPLQGDVLDWPAGTLNESLGTIYYTGSTSAIIPASISPTTIYQGIVPLTQL
ncbi:hypothetical protein [Dinghuibacter silviterrae]|uniref:Uncharacterized protein n=1 Tax=Dinghuibacter silviterrae TaxID=1539049 RepID=A0A4R8DFF1_9BACT|nr:hypothetical protein [Dinghuibacter silviterrae]TDW96319.1 hypothetical protein EDB95_4145 [Dinghuibacter silviterrae]